MSLTLVLLNKLRCHAYFQFSANQITWSSFLIQIHILNGKQCRSRSVGFFRSQLIWIYTVCKGRAYPGSTGLGLMMHLDFLPFPPNETIVLTSVCFPVHKALLLKRSTLHGRNLLPFRSKVFPYRVVLSEGNKAMFTELSPLKVYQFPLEHMATA